MRKYFKFLLVFVFLLSFNSVKAVTYNEATNAINEATKSMNDFLTKLNNWIVGNEDAVIYLTKEEIIGKIDSSNYAKTVDLMIQELNDGYLSFSASDLNDIRNVLISDLNSIKKNHELIYNYLKENEEYGTSGNLDILHELKKYSNNIDKSTGTIMSSLNKIYFNDLNIMIDSYDFNDAINYLNDALSVFNKLLDVYATNMSNWQDLYNSYINSEYEEKINNDSFYNKYITKLNKTYDKYYNLIYSNYNSKLNSTISEIDKEDTDAVVHNNKIFGIIDNINTSKTALQNNFNTLKKKVKINEIKKNVETKQNDIINKLEKSVDEVRTHLWDTVILDVKNANDKKYFNINSKDNLIKFSGGIVNSYDFDLKLKTDYSKFEYDNLYDGKVGTGSKISVWSSFSLYADNIKISEYTITVAGDVEADGKISALDYIAIRNEIMKTKTISNNLSRIAADCNSDNKISALDYIYIRNYIMNGGI